jgi:hypothetical protein
MKAKTDEHFDLMLRRWFYGKSYQTYDQPRRRLSGFFAKCSLAEQGFTR